jgi:hypothetical protein
MENKGIGRSNFHWFVENKYKGNEHLFKVSSFKCKCNHKASMVEQTVFPKWLPALPMRHFRRFIDFKNESADYCFNCGWPLENVHVLSSLRKYIKRTDIYVSSLISAKEQIKELNEDYKKNFSKR